MRLFCLLLLPLTLTVTCPAAPPNILLIYSDDHGWADLGEQGVNGDIRTPNMDQLVRDGIRCHRGYVSAPQCVPSRAGVLTGRYQERFGVEDNTKGPLPLEEVSIAERLKPAGYVTGQVGKWHLDLPAEGKGKKDRTPLMAHMPHGQGFDEYWRGEIGRFFASHDLEGKPFPDAPHLVEDRRFRVSVQTEAALGFLDRRRAKPEQPWFLYLAYFAPHVPLESPEPWFSRTLEGLTKERRQALAMIAAMDEGIGEIRAKLKEMGQEKNTLIFFISDNGAPTKEGHWDGSINLPLIGEKGMLTDGGTRVPFVVAWPGTLPAGRVYEHPVVSLDVAATANALAGLPADPRLDGVNLMPFLKGEDKAAPHERLFWRWRTQAAVLEFPWKLIRLGPGEQFLFDVTTPEGEKKNLLAEHPDFVQRLNERLKKWSDELKPPGLPTEVNDQDATFFADHIDPRFRPAPKAAAAAPGSVQGWLCRNGTLQQKGGALIVTPEAEAKAPPFITLSPLDIAGPVTLKLMVRGDAAGPGSVTWRVRREAGFDPAKRVPLTWNEGAEWHPLTVEVPSTSNIIHLRVLLPAKAKQVEIQSITVERDGKAVQAWNFKQQASAS